MSKNHVDSEIIHEEKLIKSQFTGLFETTGLIDYFQRILKEVEPLASYTEEVDFCGVTDFNISYNDFSQFSRQAAEMYESGRVSKTIFRVADELQFGMARLFSSSTGVDDHHFEIIRKGSG